MFSLSKYFPSLPNKLLPTPKQHHHVQSFTLITINSSSSGSNSTSNDNENSPIPTRPSITPPDTVEIRFRRGTRRKKKEGGEMPVKVKASPPKDWESMTLSEKAIELYVGEKGLLFWLNKFAYASIFIIIGGWILFRFVGPALNLYQLDTPPLEPKALFKG